MYETVDALFTGICDAIREKDGTTALIAHQDIPERIAAIQGNGVPESVRKIMLRAEPEEGGVVTGYGIASDLMKITISAVENEGFIFDGWEDRGTVISTLLTYTFIVSEDINLIAKFHKKQLTWTAATLPSNASWYSITFGDGKFVAVAGGSSKAAYSTDGITWTAATLPSSASWRSVVYGDGKFVAVAYNSSKAAYSTDGIAWTTEAFPLNANWHSVAYGDGKFIAVTYSSNKAAYGTMIE